MSTALITLAPALSRDDNSLMATQAQLQPSTPPSSPAVGRGASALPVWRGDHERVLASGLYPTRPNARTLEFFAQTKTRLENAAQHNRVFPMPAVPAGTPGWRTSTLHRVMGQDKPVLVPRDMSPPDNSVADMQHKTRAAFEYYLSTRADAFRQLTFEGREFARSAIVVLLDNVRQPAGTPGRLDPQQIPAALRLIDDMAKAMGRPTTAYTRTAATSLTEPPQRTGDENVVGRRAAQILDELNTRPGSSQGLLDRDAWRDAAAVVPPAVRRHVIEWAFAQYREALQDAYASEDWSGVEDKVLASLGDIEAVAGQRPDAFEAVAASPEWKQVQWQQRFMGFVRFYQSLIDESQTGEGSPLSDWQRNDMRAQIRTKSADILRGTDGALPPGAAGEQIVKQAVRQLGRLMQQLKQ